MEDHERTNQQERPRKSRVDLAAEVFASPEYRLILDKARADDERNEAELWERWQAIFKGR